MFEDINFKYKPRQQNVCADHLVRKFIIDINEWSIYNSCLYLQMTTTKISNKVFRKKKKKKRYSRSMFRYV